MARAAAQERPGIVVACILCGDDRFADVYAIQGHHVRCCQGCGLTQLCPLPDAKTIAAIYGPEYYASAGGAGYTAYAADESDYQHTFRTDLARIEDFYDGRRPLRILDDGCGPGAFLGLALAAGHDVHGVDIIPSIVEQARARFPGRVHLGYLGAIPELELMQFDVVFASHVIEHVPEPVMFTNTCRRLLVDGGAVVYVTPNIRSVLARISGRRWVSFKIPEHVAYYDPATISRLLGRCGFEAPAVEPAYEYHNLRFLAHRFRTLIHPADRMIPAIESIPAVSCA